MKYKKESVDDENSSYTGSLEESDQIFNDDMIYNFLAKTSLKNVDLRRSLNILARGNDNLDETQVRSKILPDSIKNDGEHPDVFRQLFDDLL